VYLFIAMDAFISQQEAAGTAQTGCGAHSCVSDLIVLRCHAIIGALPPTAAIAHLGGDWR